MLMPRKSKNRWVTEHKQDHYYREAKSSGYRSRAAYKLKQIQKKFNIISKNDIVIDLGAAPGGWSQIAYELIGGGDEETPTNGKVIAIDLKSIRHIPGVDFIRGDMTDLLTFDRIFEIADQADAVISDMSPDITGHYSVDQARSVYLAENAFEFAAKVLVHRGNFVVKVFQGEDFKQFFDRVKPRFKICKTYSPKASRTRSSEVYIVAKGYRRE
jgi:23S rRNA (uridine2552-2'-O)-methyltransferase